MLIVLPFILLPVVAIAQMIARAAIADANDEGMNQLVTMVVNLISILAGAVAIICLLLIPLWIVFLVRDLSQKK